MKTYEIEDGTFTTDGSTDDHGNIVGELTNYRGTRRWVVSPASLPVVDATPVDVTPVAVAPAAVVETIPEPEAPHVEPEAPAA
jgi:hypothetical protein